MFEDLKQPEYIHVLLNPLPVYGLAMGTLALFVSLLFKSRTAQLTSLILVFVAAGSAWPVYVYGEHGYDRVYAMADRDGQAWLDAHRRRAEKFIYVFYALALRALVGIGAPFKWPNSMTALAIVTLGVAIGTLCLGSWIAYAGGKIRHREFRNEQPPKPESNTSRSVTRDPLLKSHQSHERTILM
jgi:hypothetical protein